MSNSNGEVFGARVLNAAIIIAAAALLLASLTSPAPQPVSQVAAPAKMAEQIVVLGHRG